MTAATSPLVARVDGGPAVESRLGRTALLPGQTPAGEYILAVLVKRSYGIVPGGRCVRAASDQKLNPGDKHYGDPMNSTVKFESDFVPFKLATDVVLNGRAYAPAGQSAYTAVASLAVGPVRKDVLVIGDRVARYRQGADPLFTEPEPFTTMELRYERAYGGVDIYSDVKVPCAYGRNHLGRGFAVTNTQRAVEGLALPNLEDPADPLTPARLTIGHFIHWERQPMPAGFGWWLKYWRPRARKAGVLPAHRATEQELRKAYRALVPAAQLPMYDQTGLPDMDFRFFNGASPGLVLPYLAGDEAVRAVNLTPDGELTFSLPGERPRIALDLGAGPQEAAAVLHTVMVRMEEGEVDLVWRGAVPYAGPDWLPQARKLEVLVT
jgi:hypothetical protein